MSIMRNPKVILLIFFWGLAAHFCSAAGKAKFYLVSLDQASIGMSKREIIRLKGKPDIEGDLSENPNGHFLGYRKQMRGPAVTIIWIDESSEKVIAVTGQTLKLSSDLVLRTENDLSSIESLFGTPSRITSRAERSWFYYDSPGFAVLTICKKVTSYRIGNRKLGEQFYMLPIRPKLW
jgi:hypothetical protein